MPYSIVKHLLHQHNTDHVCSILGTIVQNMFKYAHLVRKYSMVKKEVSKQAKQCLYM